MIATGSKLNSLSQVSRALNGGYTVQASLVYNDVVEQILRFVQQDVIVKMTDLHESAYNQLVGIEDYECGPCDRFDMFYSWWEFVVVER